MQTHVRALKDAPVPADGELQRNARALVCLKHDALICKNNLAGSGRLLSG